MKRETRPKNGSNDRKKTGTPLPRPSESSKSMKAQTKEFSPKTSMSKMVKRMK